MSNLNIMTPPISSCGKKIYLHRGTIVVNQTGKKQFHAHIVQKSACFTAEKCKPQQNKNCDDALYQG
jgi:hypothetical protein